MPEYLNSAIQKALCYEPQLNPSYQESVKHCVVVILQDRGRKSCEKAMVEDAVLIVER